MGENILEDKTLNQQKRQKVKVDRSNIIKDAIKNNSPIENKLNIIVVISNPCLYAKRYKLANEFKSKLNILTL